MNYLADTHIALWLWHDPTRLSPAQLEILQTAPTVYLSAASIWEMAIKAGLGKLEVPAGLLRAVEDEGFRILPVQGVHAEAVRHLPRHHADPFDRLLIAQARSEGLTILSADAAFASYDVRVI